MTTRSLRLIRWVSASALALVGMTSAHAQSVYVGGGFLGLNGGYAHRINDNWGLRADAFYLGSKNATQTESGTQFQAHAAWNRYSALVDWHPGTESGWRVTAGLSFNDMGFDLTASGAGQTVDINGNKYTLGSSNDSFKVKVAMPKTTPYLGVGYGHHKGQTGLGFYSDVGVLIGSLKVSESRTGILANGGSAGLTQAQVDAELKDIRDGVSKMSIIPQLTLGLTYRF